MRFQKQALKHRLFWKQVLKPRQSFETYTSLETRHETYVILETNIENCFFFLEMSLVTYAMPETSFET